jgi:hypothetical protein
MNSAEFSGIQRRNSTEFRSILRVQNGSSNSNEKWILAKSTKFRKISVNSMLCRTKNRLNLAKSAKIEVALKNDVEIEFCRICQNPYQLLRIKLSNLKIRNIQNWFLSPQIFGYKNILITFGVILRIL